MWCRNQSEHHVLLLVFSSFFFFSIDVFLRIQTGILIYTLRSVLNIDIVSTCQGVIRGCCYDRFESTALCLTMFSTLQEIEMRLDLLRLFSCHREAISTVNCPV